MQVYLVGGAVRDKLLDIPHAEKDWVVIGATPEEMIEQGFKPVGKDFPVFLHPKTHEEYALARTERKIAKGYKGFEFHASPEVTLEEDLRRRDLTINAIAETEHDELIDLFNGQKDLKDHILRHVSDAFVEDPVRVLRVARFAAKFGDFKVAPETIELMRQMVKSGEVDALVSERVWQELQQALCEASPHRFFEVLRDCDALKIIFPEIDALSGVPNPEKHHPEIDTFIHTMIALQQAVKLTDDPVIRFAVLLHDLGKAKTPKENWPKHHDHAKLGVPLVKAFCNRLRAPTEYRHLAILMAHYHHDCIKIKEFGADAILSLLNKLDAFRRPGRFKKFLVACQADVRGRTGFENDLFSQKEYLENIYERCTSLKISEEIKSLPNNKIAEKIYEMRLKIVKDILEK